MGFFPVASFFCASIIDRNETRTIDVDFNYDMKHGHADCKWGCDQLGFSTLLVLPIILVTTESHQYNIAKIHHIYWAK